MQRIVDLAPYLLYFDGTGAGQVPAIFGYGMLYNLMKVQKFAVMPSNETSSWFAIFNCFKSRMIFGSCIVETLPEKGDVMKLLKLLEKEI